MRRRWSVLAGGVALSVALGAMLTGASPASAATTGGDNSKTCKLTAAHPRPVILVHGTVEDSGMWNNLVPQLVAQGYCTFRFNYGTMGTADIAKSAAELATEVNLVQSYYPGVQVDMIGHSQGGMMPRYYFKFLGGASKVKNFVGLAPDNHGTTLQGIADLGFDQKTGTITFLGGLLNLVCTSCIQQINNSAFITNLNAGGDTAGADNIYYTVVMTKSDEVVTPYTSGRLTGSHVNNIVIQDKCGFDFSGHIQMAGSDTNTWYYIYKALDPAYNKPLNCGIYAPSP